MACGQWHLKRTNSVGLRSLLVLIPARGGSKRLPGKNLRDLGGVPLIEHTARALADAELDTNPCLLSTDDGSIAAHGRRLGWLVPWLRPADLATDESPTIDTVFHALQWYVKEYGEDPERIMVLQPTSPLRGSACLVDAISALDVRAGTDAVVGMRPLNVPNRIAYRIDAEGYAEPIEVSGDLTPNGAVYLIRTTALRAHRSLYPPRTMPLNMDAISSIDIDTESDWRLAEAALTMQQQSSCAATENRQDFS